MLKISVIPDEGTDRLRTEVESSGPMDDVVAELGLAVLRMHKTINESSPMAARHFREALTSMFCNPAFWGHEVKGQVLEQTAILGIGKRPKA